MKRVAVTLSTAVVLTFSGCATDEVAARPVAPIQPSPWESCEAAGAPVPPVLVLPDEQAPLPRLPEDFAAVAVTTCGRMYTDQGVVAGERHTDDRAAVEALAATLLLPDLPREGDCAAWADFVPWFVLHDSAGRWVRPGTPHDECGRTRAEVHTALDALPLTTVSG